MRAGCLRAAGFFVRAWLPDGRLRGGEDVRVAMARAETRRRDSGGTRAVVQGPGRRERAAALPAGLDSVLRCLLRSRQAGALPRLALGSFSERASTGRLGGSLVWVLGPWVGLG